MAAIMNHKTQPSGDCPGFQKTELSRRALLSVGGVSLLGLSPPGLLQATERSSPSRARAKSIIFLHQFGGPSHLDTLDMKPAAPEARRGYFKPIATKYLAIVL